jgi:RNA-directed DNA polymerase
VIKPEFTQAFLYGNIMDLEQQIAKVIKEEADKLISRYHEYHNRMHLEQKRNEKRLGISASKKIIHVPDYWSHDKKFNPFYVRRRHKNIARSIAKNIESRAYTPNPPYLKTVAKSDGGERIVSIFQIQDAAISKLFFNMPIGMIAMYTLQYRI